MTKKISSQTKDMTQRDLATEVKLNNTVDTYITEMKELPPVKEKDNPNLGKTPLFPEKNLLPEIPKEKAKPALVTSKSSNTLQEDASFEKENESKKKFPLSSKDLILGIINLVSIILLIIVISRFPDQAARLKKLNNDFILNESGVSFEFSEIETSKKKADEINNLYLDESGVVNFVNELEKMKGETSTFNKVILPNQKAVKDRTGSFGIPVIIELKGSWDFIASDLLTIQKLTYLFRPAVTEIYLDKEDPSVINFKYGGMLYVTDRLGQN